MFLQILTLQLKQNIMTYHMLYHDISQYYDAKSFSSKQQAKGKGRKSYLQIFSQVYFAHCSKVRICTYRSVWFWIPQLCHIINCREKQNKKRKEYQCSRKVGHAVSLHKHRKKELMLDCKKQSYIFFLKRLVSHWKSLKLPQGQLELESEAKHKDTSLKPNPLVYLKYSCSFWSGKHTTGIPPAVLLVFFFLVFSKPNNSNIWTSINTTKIKADGFS